MKTIDPISTARQFHHRENSRLIPSALENSVASQRAQALAKTVGITALACAVLAVVGWRFARARAPTASTCQTPDRASNKPRNALWQPTIDQLFAATRRRS